MEKDLLRWKELKWQDRIDSYEEMIKELKEGAPDAQTLETPAASEETKKMKLVYTDKHRVQTNHETKMRGLEDEKTKAKGEIEEMKKRQKKKEEEQEEEYKQTKEFTAKE